MSHIENFNTAFADEDDKEPALIINPLTLYFPPPLNRIITNILKLQNPSDKDFVAYKVKTTRPQRYCVRPNIGVIPPGETIELQIHFSFHKDPPKSLHCKDKFQVESLILDPSVATGEDISLSELFKSVSSDQIHRQKLKCRFSSPTPTKVGAGTKHADVPGKSSKGNDKKDGRLEKLNEAGVVVTALSGTELQQEYPRVLAQLQATQKERDAAKAQVKELLSQIQQYQEKDIDSGFRRHWNSSQAVVGGVKKQALRLTGFDLSLIFLAAFVAFLIGYFHIVL
jgi:hypothetical protein